jgi:hypothetical protein
MPTSLPTTKKVSRAGLVEIYEALGNIKVCFDLPAHRWTAASMRTRMKEHIEPIVEQKTDAEKKRPNEFMEARDLLVRSYAKLDETGRPMASQNQYVIDPALRAEFEEAALALREKHKEKIDEFEAEVKKVNDFLREEIVATLPAPLHLKLSWFNKNVQQDTLEILFDLIEDDVTGVEVPAPASAKKAEKKAEKKT